MVTTGRWISGAAPARPTGSTHALTIPPGVYRHWKGHLYQVLLCARDSGNGPGNGRTVVVYVGLTLDGTPTPGLRVRVRPLAEFVELVTGTGGDPVPRFEFVAEEWQAPSGARHGS